MNGLFNWFKKDKTQTNPTPRQKVVQNDQMEEERIPRKPVVSSTRVKSLKALKEPEPIPEQITRDEYISDYTDSIEDEDKSSPINNKTKTLVETHATMETEEITVTITPPMFDEMDIRKPMDKNEKKPSINEWSDDNWSSDDWSSVSDEDSYKDEFFGKKIITRMMKLGPYSTSPPAPPASPENIEEIQFVIPIPPPAPSVDPILPFPSVVGTYCQPDSFYSDRLDKMVDEILREEDDEDDIDDIERTSKPALYESGSYDSDVPEVYNCDDNCDVDTKLETEHEIEAIDWNKITEGWSAFQGPDSSNPVFEDRFDFEAYNIAEKKKYTPNKDSVEETHDEFYQPCSYCREPSLTYVCPDCQKKTDNPFVTLFNNNNNNNNNPSLSPKYEAVMDIIHENTQITYSKINDDEKNWKLNPLVDGNWDIEQGYSKDEVEPSSSEEEYIQPSKKRRYNPEIYDDYNSEEQTDVTIEDINRLLREMNEEQWVEKETGKEGISVSNTESDSDSDSDVIILPKTREAKYQTNEYNSEDYISEEITDYISVEIPEDEYYDTEDIDIEELPPLVSDDTEDIDVDVLPPLVSDDTEDIDIEELPPLVSDEDEDSVNNTYDETTEEEYNEIGDGRLELYMGPMFSGKSTAIILRIARMADIGYDVLYINHKIDNRDTEAQDTIVSTHNSQYTTLSKKINAIKVSELRDLDIRDYQYIAVDEGQFFPDLYESVITWVTGFGKTVLVASLDGDAYRRKFGQVLDLIPNADEVNKLTAFCDLCRENEKRLRPAPFTGRFSDNTDATMVGGKDLYRAMCRKCHDNHLTETAI